MAVRTQRLPTAGRDVDRPGRLHAAWGAWRGQPVGLAGSLILLAFAALPLLYAGLRLTVWQHQRYDPVVGFDSQTEPNPAPPSWIPADWLAEDDVHRHDGNRPSWQHLLGTDTLGRDILSVLMASSVASFIVGLSAAVMTALLGLLLASLAAYHGGWIDTTITQVADAFLLIPAPIFMIAVGSYLRSRRATFLALLLSGSSGLTLTPWQEAILQPLEFGLAYGLVAGAGGATLVIRAQALKVMNKSFIAAAQVAGAGRRAPADNRPPPVASSGTPGGHLHDGHNHRGHCGRRLPGFSWFQPHTAQLGHDDLLRLRLSSG